MRFNFKLKFLSFSDNSADRDQDVRNRITYIIYKLKGIYKRIKYRLFISRVVRIGKNGTDGAT